MEKRECRVGICDDKVEDIKQIKEALQKGLEKTGEPVILICQFFTDGEKSYAAPGEETIESRFCFCYTG